MTTFRIIGPVFQDIVMTTGERFSCAYEFSAEEGRRIETRCKINGIPVTRDEYIAKRDAWKRKADDNEAQRPDDDADTARA